jgi:hypothetical protein
MKRSVRKFTGSFEQLREIVAASGVCGAWEKMPNGYVRFVCRTGAILNWWPSTGSFNLQGPGNVASELEQALRWAVEALRGSGGRLPSPGGK